MKNRRKIIAGVDLSHLQLVYWLVKLSIHWDGMRWPGTSLWRAIEPGAGQGASALFCMCLLVSSLGSIDEGQGRCQCVCLQPGGLFYV